MNQYLGRIWLLLAIPATCLADWSGFAGYGAIAELRVEADRTRLNLRLGEAALARLGGGRTPQQAAAGLLELLDGDGKPLPARPEKYRRVEADPQSPGGGAYQEAEWSYPAVTSSLTLRPRPGLGPTDLGLVALHRGVPVSDLARLGRPLRLILDPADPWRSHYDDPSLVRRHGEPRSFLYVETYEVRHEVLIRLADLLPALGAGPTGPTGPIAPAGRPPWQAKIGDYLLAHNPLSIDGTAPRPQLDRVDFLGFTRTGMVPVEAEAPLDPATALVGAVLVYLTERPARSLKLRWDSFGPGRERRGVSVIRGRESFDGELTAARPEFEWSAEEALDPLPEADPAEPQLAADPLADGQLRPLLQSLLHNAYRAFQLREEEAVYDRLAKSLDDPVLEEIYLQQRRARLQQSQGLGGEGRVERVEVLEARAAAGHGGERQIDARWRAEGEVSHWGHSHRRSNLYAARLSLRRGDGGWRIVALRFLDGHRLGPEPAP